MIIKVWMERECRRFAADPEAVTFGRLRHKIKSLYNIPSDDFTLKFKDHEGDLVTFGSDEELKEIIEMDLKHSDAVLKLHVFRKPATVDPVDEMTASMKSTNLGPTGGLVASVGDVPVEAIPNPELSRLHLLEILRDISLYIASRESVTVPDLDPVKTWVSSERNFIPPSGMADACKNNGDRFTTVVKTAVAKEGSESRVKEWGVADVEEWLEANGFADFKTTCKEHDITGEVLLALSHDNLREMKMTSTGRRIRLLNLISTLKTQ